MASEAGIRAEEVLAYLLLSVPGLGRAWGRLRVRARLVEAAPPPPRLLPLMSVPEAARFLRVSKRTVYRLVEAGQLQTVKIGPRAVRLRGADVGRIGGQRRNGTLTRPKSASLKRSCRTVP